VDVDGKSRKATQTLLRFEMSTISVRSEAAGCALGNKQARLANEDEKEPQYDAVRQADSLKALKFKKFKGSNCF
jgi:hypothetical protein